MGIGNVDRRAAIMKLSWLFVILLLVFVAVFSVQNAGVITVQFLSWEIQMSAALVIQLAALLGALVGLIIGALSKRPPRTERTPPPAESPVAAPKATTPVTPPASAKPQAQLPAPSGTTPPLPVTPARIEKKPEAF